MADERDNGSFRAHRAGYNAAVSPDTKGGAPMSTPRSPPYTAPTTAPPGSPGKVAVLACRAARRLPLFLADDAPADPGARPRGGRHAPDPRRRCIHVYADRPRRFRVRLNRGGRQHHLGYFDTLAEAVRARDAALAGPAAQACAARGS
jgi:hypothetical protein